MFGSRLTHIELAEQLQPRVTLRRGAPGRPVGLIQLEDGLLDVPLGHHPVPLVVVERRVRVHCQLNRSVAHVEREGDDFGGYNEETAQEEAANVRTSQSEEVPGLSQSTPQINMCSISNLMAHLSQGHSFGLYGFQLLQ